MTIGGHPTDKRVLAHDASSVLRVVELLERVHEKTVPKQRHPKVPCLSFPLNNYTEKNINKINNLDR
jgi:hypothetical protein